MNNTELKQVVQKIKECNNSDSQIEFYINELISDIVTPILTAAKVSSVDEVVALLERKRDHQGFLINTDVDDTMEVKNTFLQSSLVNAMKFGNETMEHLFVSLGERLGKFDPLSDEELTKLASDMFDSGDIDNTTSFKLGYKAAANRPQAGWIDVKDRLPEEECKSVLVYAPRSFPKNSRCVVAEYKDDVKGFYSESDEIFMEDVTHWCELPNEPLPPKPKQ